MKLIRCAVALACVGQVWVGLAQSVPNEPAAALELQGKFKEAATTLTNAIAHATPEGRKPLEFELDRLSRIRKDYRLTKEGLFGELQDSVKDLTREEFEKWVREGRFDSREIDGVLRFVGTSVSNLYFRYPELEPRRLKAKNPAAFEQAVLASVEAIQKAARAQQQPYVLPKRFQNTMTVIAKTNAAPAGAVIRAWLPIPRRYPFEQDFELRASTPPPREINARDSSVRAVYLEQTARANQPTKFEITYEYTAYGVRFEIDPEAVKPANHLDPELAPFLKEAAHVVFTPELRELSQSIVGAETNDFRKAKRCFDWISDQIKYSFAIEYSTIRNISDYCRTKKYGDCGQEALLFITLCRWNGIPARWQSGWNTFPGGQDIHDWTEIYLAPYGWIPVDPYMGIWATRYARTLTPEQQREIRDFYFGGLDQYRVAANSDHSQELSPPKNSFRSDNVDFQRGELEWGNHNIYFDRYSYDLEVREVKLPSKE